MGSSDGQYACKSFTKNTDTVFYKLLRPCLRVAAFAAVQNFLSPWESRITYRIKESSNFPNTRFLLQKMI